MPRGVGYRCDRLAHAFVEIDLTEKLMSGVTAELDQLVGGADAIGTHQDLALKRPAVELAERGLEHRSKQLPPRMVAFRRLRGRGSTRMTDRSVHMWVEQVRDSYSTYSPPPEAVGMTTRHELCFVEAYARDIFSGAGRIVDLGCWYGATTAALARGLHANAHAENNAVVEAYDLFVWETWMDGHAERLKHLGKRYHVNDCFLPDVAELLRPYGDLVTLEQRDLLEPKPPGPPIEFLFIDAMKSWALGQSIVKSFFPSLIPKKSYVVQQDFVWYHPAMLSAHLLMWYMRDHFEFVHHVPWSCSAVFRYTKVLDSTEIRLPPPEFFTLEMIHEAYEYSAACAESARVDYVKAGKLFFLLERGFYEAALQEGRALFEVDRNLPPNLVGGMANLMSTYRKRAASETTSQDQTSAVSRVEAIEKLILQASSFEHKN